MGGGTVYKLGNKLIVLLLLLSTEGSPNEEDEVVRNKCFLDGDFDRENWPKTPWAPFASKYEAVLYLIAHIPGYCIECFACLKSEDYSE